MHSLYSCAVASFIVYITDGQIQANLLFFKTTLADKKNGECKHMRKVYKFSETEFQCAVTAMNIC